jgi:hypothetical protein
MAVRPDSRLSENQNSLAETRLGYVNAGGVKMLSSLIRYFDLQSSQRTLTFNPVQSAGLIFGDLKNLKDLRLSTRLPPGLTGGPETSSPEDISPAPSKPSRGAGAKRHAPVFPQYLAVSAGVIIEPFLRHYIETSVWNVDFAAFWGRVVFGLIVSIIILPGIYKSSFDPKQPVLIQIAALMPLGIGWQSIFMSATQALTG